MYLRAASAKMVRLKFGAQAVIVKLPATKMTQIFRVYILKKTQTFLLKIISIVSLNDENSVRHLLTIQPNLTGSLLIQLHALRVLFVILCLILVFQVFSGKNAPKGNYPIHAI